MKYCPYCGKKLEDGEVCSCRTAAETAQAPQKKVPAAAAAPAPAVPAAEGPDAGAQAGSAAAEGAAQTAPEAGDLDIMLEAGKVFHAGKEKTSGFFGKIFGNKKTRLAVIIGAAALLVVIVALIVILNVAGNNYMGPIRRLEKELNKGEDADYLTAAYALYPADFAKDLRTLNVGTDSTDNIQDDLEDDMEDLSDTFDDWKLSFVVSGKKKMDEEDLESIMLLMEYEWDAYYEKIVDDLKDWNDDDYEAMGDLSDDDVKSLKKKNKTLRRLYEYYDNPKVSAGYQVKGYWKLEDDGELIDKTDRVTLNVVKINGDWCVYSAKSYDIFSFEDRSNKEYYDYKFLVSDYCNNFFSDSDDLPTRNPLSFLSQLFSLIQ